MPTWTCAKLQILVLGARLQIFTGTSNSTLGIRRLSVEQVIIRQASAMRDAIQQADSGENGHGDLKEVPKPGNKTVNGMNGSNGVMEPPKRFTNAVKVDWNLTFATGTAADNRIVQSQFSCRHTDSINPKTVFDIS